MFTLAEIVERKFFTIFNENKLSDFNGLRLGSLQFDSRKLQVGETFVALEGVRDGHDFLVAAVTAGAKGFIVNEQTWKSLDKSVKDTVSEAGPVFLVEDTLLAMGKIAMDWRGQFNIPIFAVGGSNGKTTTKDMLAKILCESYGSEGAVLFPQGSFNNEIGIPYIISQLSSKHKAAVLEIGGNDFGEIGYLTELSRPQAAIITNIGDDHLEFFRDRRGVFRANWEMIEWLPPSDGLWVVNRDDPILHRANESLKLDIRTVTYSIRDSKADYYAGIMDKLGEEGNFGYRVRFSGERCDYVVEARLPYPGIHNVQNALAAFCVAVEFFGCDPEVAVSALEKVKFSKYRSEIIKTKSGAFLFNDCYNANPSSLEAALRMVHDSTNGKFVVALGDFLEVGGDADEIHRQVGAMAVSAGAMAVGASGKYADQTVEGAMSEGLPPEDCRIADSPEQLVDFFVTQMQAGYHLLVKGSRGAEMERLVSAVKQKIGAL